MWNLDQTDEWAHFLRLVRTLAIVQTTAGAAVVGSEPEELGWDVAFWLVVAEAE